MHYLGELHPSYDTLQVKTKGKRIQRAKVHTPLSAAPHIHLYARKCADCHSRALFSAPGSIKTPTRPLDRSNSCLEGNLGIDLKAK